MRDDIRPYRKKGIHLLWTFPSRYIVRDDPEQTRAATRFLEGTCTADQPGWVCLVVLGELAWVLTRAYKYERDTVCNVLNQLLLAAELQVEQSVVVWRALADDRTGKAEFTDYLIGRVNAAAEVEYTITLDRKAAQHPLFRLLQT